jgi:hypothetical protein
MGREVRHCNDVRSQATIGVLEENERKPIQHRQAVPLPRRFALSSWERGEAAEELLRNPGMATTIHGFPAPAAIVGKPAGANPTRRGKKISRSARRALRILAHAIEYVANEFLLESNPPGPRNARLQAVKLLMAADRQVVSECPEMPTLAQRCRYLLRAQD